MKKIAILILIVFIFLYFFLLSNDLNLIKKLNAYYNTINEDIIKIYPQDLNSDGFVDMKDIDVLKQSFGSEIGEKKYNEKHDFISNDGKWVADGKINGAELIATARYIGILNPEFAKTNSIAKDHVSDIYKAKNKINPFEYSPELLETIVGKEVAKSLKKEFPASIGAEKAGLNIEKLWNERYYKPYPSLEEYLKNEFSREKFEALLNLNLSEESLMNNALAEAMSYSGDKNFIQNYREFVELIRKFPKMNDTAKNIEQYNFFNPILAQPTAKWKFAFDIYNKLREKGIDVAKFDNEMKLRFFSYIETRGIFYEGMSKSKGAQDYLTEITTENIKELISRLEFLRKNKKENIQKTFPDLYNLANPVSFSFLESFRKSDGTFKNADEMTDAELIKFIDELYGRCADGKTIDEKMREWLEFAKATRGNSYLHAEHIKTDLLRAPDIYMPLDIYYTPWYNGQKYFGYYGQKTIEGETNEVFSNAYAITNLLRVFKLSNSISKKDMIKLGIGFDIWTRNEMALETILNVAADNSIVQMRGPPAIGEKATYTYRIFSLIKRDYYDATDAQALQLLGGPDNKKWQRTEIEILNPVLLDPENLFNYERALIKFTELKGKPRIITPEMLDMFK